MPWYVDFFDENYFKTYYHLDWKNTEKDVDFIEKALKLTPEDLILDIPCGFGRHSIELTKRGYKVVGMEYNKHQIDKAKELMKEEGAEFEVLQADMRDIPHKEWYDKIFNYFTSFGYFSEEENEATMDSFYKALKPGGLFLLEMINRDAVLIDYQPCHISHLPEDELLLEERSYESLTGRMSATHTYINKEGKKFIRKFSHRMYSVHELIAIFKRYGFEIVDVFGRWGEEFKISSRRISIVGKK